MLDLTDGFLATTRPTTDNADASAHQQHHQADDGQAVSGDFLAMSDQGADGGEDDNNNNGHNSPSSLLNPFKMSWKDMSSLCPGGECSLSSMSDGRGDALRVISQLAKRILSDPRIMGLRTYKHAANDTADHDNQVEARAIGGSNFDTRPFTSSSDYYGQQGSMNNRMSDNTGDNYRTRDRYAANSNDNYASTSSAASYAGDSVASAASYDRDDSYGYGGGDSYGGGGYDSYGGGGGGYGGGYETCCGQNNKLLPIFLVGLLGILAFWLYIRSTTTASGRKLRTGFGGDDSVSDNDGIINKYTQKRRQDVYQVLLIDRSKRQCSKWTINNKLIGIVFLFSVLLDGPTWLSMVHELWEQDGATENLACAQETLCRMNRLAMAAPGQAGWAVSMSR